MWRAQGSSILGGSRTHDAADELVLDPATSSVDLDRFDSVLFSFSWECFVEPNQDEGRDVIVVDGVVERRGFYEGVVVLCGEVIGEVVKRKEEVGVERKEAEEEFEKKGEELRKEIIY